MHEEWDENYNRGYEWWLMKEAKKVRLHYSITAPALMVNFTENLIIMSITWIVLFKAVKIEQRFYTCMTAFTDLHIIINV